MMQGPVQPGNVTEFLKEVYKNQLEQRWRGSRNQDWGVVGIVATMAAAAAAIQYADIEFPAEGVKWFFPLMVAAASIVGLRILHLHQGVMKHANHIAKGIERALGIYEREFEEKKRNEKRKPNTLPDTTSSADTDWSDRFKLKKANDLLLRPEYPLFVGFDNEGFKYPSKGTFTKIIPVRPYWFFQAFTKAGNVQASMGWFHVLFFAGFLLLFIVRFYDWLVTLIT